MSAVFPVNVTEATLDKQVDYGLKGSRNTGKIKKIVMWGVLD